MKYLITMSAAELIRLQKRIRDLFRGKSRLELVTLLQAKNELHKNGKRLREFLSLLPQTICEIDCNGNLIYANHKAYKILGYSKKDFTAGLNVLHVLKPEDWERVRATLQNVLKGSEITSHEYTATRRDGSPFSVKIFPTPIVHDNETVGMKGNMVSIPHPKYNQEEIARSEHLGSIGILAGGIAHDFNNLLTAVLGNITLAKMNLKPEVKARLRLEEAEKAIIRAKDLTQQLLSFSKEGAPVTRPISIGTLVKESAAFALCGSNVHCEFAVSPDLWPVEINEGQICQVIHNLVINADQAMPNGGIIRISCENLTIEDNNSFPPVAGNYVKMTFQDRGSGIPAVILARIFEPYFTTKQNGSGLGLETASYIIKKHGGYISVESTLGEGTTFTIYLPAAETATQVAKPVSVRTCTMNAKILFMDDDDMIREVACEMLKKLGHEVEPARDGAEAVRMYRKAINSGRSYDVVVMDLTVPGGMGAVEGINKLVEIDASVKVLVSSGYSNAAVMIDYEKYGFSGRIVKPYKYDEFATTIANILESQHNQLTL